MERNWRFAVSPAIGILDSDFGYGGTIEFLYKVGNMPLYAGVESGFLYWSDSAFGISASMTSIPILPTISYRFGSDSAMTPYIGLGAGIAIDRLDVSFGGASGSTTETHFEVLLKPGIEFSRFFVEPKIGFLKDQFLAVASLGYRF